MIINGKVRHTLVCSDTEKNKIVFVDEDGVITNEIDNTPGIFDLWALPDGDILFCQNSGMGTTGVYRVERCGKSVMRYLTKKELFSCQPLENGNILLGLLGEPQLLEITSDGDIVKSFDVGYQGLPHEGMRMARKIGDCYYVVQPGINKIRKLSADGEIVKEYDIHPDAFGMVLLPNGNIVYSCMSGAYELNENGEEVWSLTDADVPGINIRWLLGVQLLSNGNLVFTNWMGHGHFDEGVHVFEVDRQKNIVWSMDSRGTLGMPSVTQILDEDCAKVCFDVTK